MKPDSGEKLEELASQERLDNDESASYEYVDPMVGSVLGGHLEILDVVGTGGMSVVYRAKDLLLNRIVAVKVLLPHASLSPTSILRFRQEAMAASKLIHPNIINIHEFNVPEKGQPYLVMDFLEGESLADLIAKNGPIELQRAISILCQVCDGLEAAHEAGVIHRDLKPGNIVIAKSETGRRIAKIVDFGIAKVYSDNENLHALTQTGELFGSPLYMSPEQCQGEQLDSRSDIYSLGCVMYEMVTGQPPLKGHTVIETIQLQATAMPKSVREVHHNIKKAEQLDAVLLKAMAKNPNQRYQKAAEFKSALGAINTRLGTGIITEALLRLEVLRNKRAAGLFAGVPHFELVAYMVALAIIVGAFSLWSRSPRNQEVYTPTSVKPGSTSAAKSWENCDLEAQKCVDHGEYQKAAQFYDTALFLAKNHKDWEISTLQGLIDLYTLTDQDPTALMNQLKTNCDEFANNRTLIQRLKSPASINNAQFARATIIKSIETAAILNSIGRYDESYELLQLALLTANNNLKSEKQILARCYLALADTAMVCAPSLEEAYRIKALKILEKMPGDELLGQCTYGLANLHARNSDFAKAKPFLVQTINEMTKLHHEQTLPVAYCHYWLACSFVRPGNQAEANPEADRESQMAESILKNIVSSDPEYLQLHALLEEAHQHFEKSLLTSLQALHSLEQQRPENYYRIAKICREIFFAQRGRGYSSLLESLMNRRFAILKRLSPQSLDAEADDYVYMCQMYASRNIRTMSYRRALQHLIILEEAMPEGAHHGRNLTKDYFEMATLLRSPPADLNAAASYALKSKRLAERESAANKSLDIAEIDTGLALIYVDQREADKARPLLAQAVKIFRSTKPNKKTDSRILADYNSYNKQAVAALSAIERNQESGI